MANSSSTHETSPHPRVLPATTDQQTGVASLRGSLPAAEARRILRWHEFHYTPNHANWFNMVEFEVGVLRRQCLGRRNADRKTSEAEIAVWERQGNDSNAQVNYAGFSTRYRMARAHHEVLSKWCPGVLRTGAISG